MSQLTPEQAHAEWSRIHRMTPEQLEREGRGRWVTPAQALPPPGPPACPSHCSGGHHYDGQIECLHCHGVAWRIVAHEWIHMAGHYFYTHESVNGAPAVLPKEPYCTTCGGRRWMIRR